MRAKQAVYVKTQLGIILRFVNIANDFSTQNKQALCFPCRKLEHICHDNSSGTFGFSNLSKLFGLALGGDFGCLVVLELL